MANSIEAQGHTIDEAIQIALNQLGVSRDKVEIDIVHHPRRGVLGIGARRAKVRATVRESVMLDGEEFDMSGGAALDDKPRRRRRRGGRNRGGREGAEPRTDKPQARPAQGGREGARPDRQDRPDRPERADTDRRDSKRGGEEGGRNRGEGGRTDRPERQDRQERRGGRGREARGDRAEPRGDRNNPRQDRGEAKAESQPRGPQERERRDSRERAPRGEQARSEQGGRGHREQSERGRGDAEQGERGRDSGSRGRQDSSRTNDNADAPELATSAAAGEMPRPSQRAHAEARRAEPPEPLDAAALDAIRARAEELVRELLLKMGFEAEVTSSIDVATGEAIVCVKSDNEGLLIGRRGQTLDSLEHIVNRMALRGEQYVEGRVLLDIGDYRRRRRESLEELAGRLRARAVGERRTVQVSPMSPRDRRYFLQSFAEDEAVEVRALGAGFYRRVIVAPAGTGAAASHVVDTSADTDEEDLVSGFAEAEH